MTAPDPIRIAPSVLSADFSRLGEEIRVVEEAGADLLHLDVMDAHFVPNLTFGPMIVNAIDRLTELPLYTHLMMTDPRPFFGEFIEAGSDAIIVHIESYPEPVPLLREIRSLGAKAGLTLNPATPFSRIEPHLGEADVFLVMSVHPGFGGQGFLPEALPKAEAAARVKRERGLPFEIHIDGGIDLSTAPRAARAGVEVLVAGSAVFGADDPGAMVRALREAGEAARRS
jgi:ribulose-phosphate 3-epimerase